uniref:Vacuolar protein-sorting-associated protein 25 n=1 Tax=Trichuris muris TaxID=70415 RepID=A0A5S6QDQ9_TRIMR
MSSFAWPWQYNFPPFFTLQPNVETRRKQLEAWASLVLRYAEEKRISQIVVLDAQQSELFNNTRLNRNLGLDGIISVLDYLKEKSRVVWLDKQKGRCRIYWKSPAEWAALIDDWASRNGLRNTVCTLYEVAHGPDSVDEPFYNLEDASLLEALRHLEKSGHAEVIQCMSVLSKLARAAASSSLILWVKLHADLGDVSVCDITTQYLIPVNQQGRNHPYRANDKRYYPFC